MTPLEMGLEIETPADTFRRLEAGELWPASRRLSLDGCCGPPLASSKVRRRESGLSRFDSVSRSVGSGAA